MISLADMIVSFLLFPVTLFVIIPLVMLCGWLLFKLTVPLCSRRETAQQEEHLDKNLALSETG